MCIPNRERDAAIAASNIKEWISYNPKTGKFKWIKGKGAARAGDIAGYLNSTGYIEFQFNGFRLLAHRLAWFYAYGAFPSDMIDHINGSKDDNRIRNLRDVSCAENNKNKPQSAYWLGGYISSSKNKCKSRNIFIRYNQGIKYYAVRVELNNKQIYFGYWHTLEEALSVRDEMLEHGWSREYFEQKYPHKVKKSKAACAKQ